MNQADKPNSGPETADDGDLDPTAAPDIVFPKRNRELMKYLVNAFSGLLDPEKAKQFGPIGAELDRAVELNCSNCAISRGFSAGLGTDPAQKDARRNRYLLRLVIGHAAPLIFAEAPLLPRSVVEGMDRYLRKSLGDIIYDELNHEADNLLYRVNTNDDKEMIVKIYASPEWRRFADNIFIRILLRFENFPQAKRSFINVVSSAMEEFSNENLEEHQFYLLFEALFRNIFVDLSNEEQTIRWDYLFGEGTTRRLRDIHRSSRKAEDKKPTKKR